MLRRSQAMMSRQTQTLTPLRSDAPSAPDAAPPVSDLSGPVGERTIEDAWKTCDACGHVMSCIRYDPSGIRKCDLGQHSQCDSRIYVYLLAVTLQPVVVVFQPLATTSPTLEHDVLVAGEDVPTPCDGVPPAGDDVFSSRRWSVSSRSTPRICARRHPISAAVSSSGVSFQWVDMHLLVAPSVCPSGSNSPFCWGVAVTV